MIGIGINENVILGAIEFSTEKKTLDIGFEEAPDSSKPDNFFDVLESSETLEIPKGVSIKLFPPMPPNPDKGRTEQKNVEMIVADLNRTKAICYHILNQFMTTDALKETFKMFTGVPIDKDNFNQQILKKEIMEQCHQNICTTFVQHIKPFLEEKRLFRLKLIRQSADKAFATLPGKYLEENPFIEPMEIPAEGSKVKFTKYELENGLDSTAPTKKPEAGNIAASGAAPVTAANVFGS